MNLPLQQQDLQHLSDTWPLLRGGEMESLRLFAALREGGALLETPSAGPSGGLHARALGRAACVDPSLAVPDAAADVIRKLPEAFRRKAFEFRLNLRTAAEDSALMAYAEDRAGESSSPRYARLRPEMTVEEAIGY